MSVPAAAIDPEPPEQPAPGGELSAAQLRLWLLSRLDPDSPVRTVALAVRLKGRLDIQALRHALRDLLIAHPILRTRFPAVDGSPSAVVGPAPADALDVAPAAAVNDPCAWALRPFDLWNGPLLRASLLAVGDAEHVLALSAHRIVCDRRSLELVAGELGARYATQTAGDRPPRPEPEHGYVALASRQRAALGGPEGERLLRHWLAVLGDRPSVLDLPADRLRPAAQTFRGATVRTVIDGVCPAPSALIAALGAVVHRYTGAGAVHIGLEIDGREQPGTDAIVGPLANTLVLRLTPDATRTFAALVAQADAALVDAREHARLPFAVLVEHADPERSLSHSPLFQVAFDHRRALDVAARWGGLSAEAEEVDLGVAPVDLMLTVTGDGEPFVCDLTYSTDLFDAERVGRMGEHVRTLLHAGLADPGTTLAELPMLTPGERHRLLVDWNDTAASYPEDRCTHELFELAVDAHRDSIAAQWGQERLTYAELDGRVNRLAARLRRVGVGVGGLVGLCLPRSLDMLVAALAIMKAGGAYVPLDPRYPAERIAFMLQDSGAPVLITTEALSTTLPDHGAQTIRLDGDAAEIAAEPDVRPAGAATPADLAYVIYTSGSTGRPKGVQIPHRALVNLLWAFRDLLAITARDTLVAVTSLSFDIAGLELFLPLLSGARVVIAGAETAAHGSELTALLGRVQATIMQATPSGWRVLLDAGWDGRPLRAALCGGEAMPPDLAAALTERVPATWNAYGPTETTIWSCVQRLHRDALERIPIGRPIANTEVYLLDGQHQPVPVGIPGELYLGGDGMARGYLNQPELTAERFIPHPFSDRSGERVYRTGDLAVYGADGTIDFLGRTDHQVKVRGFRIELGEIEANVLAHPDVRTAVVLARDAGRERRLVAYVVAARERVPGRDELRSWLRRTLPDYMLPDAVVAMDALPLTPNGKIDRTSLPDPDLAGASAEPIVPPADRDERELAGIWHDLLGLERPVGVTENFFALGGSSLLAARLLTVVERSFHRPLPLSVMFEAPTVRGLAEAIHARALKTDTAVVGVQPMGSRPPLFCFSLALGGVLALRHMVAALGDDQPVLGFLVAALPWVSSESRIEDIAAAFAGEVAERQPDGPLFLFGHSLGGLVAYELARQLSAAGRELAPLTMIDTLCPSVWRRGGVARRVARRVVHGVERIRAPRPQKLFVPGTDQQQWAAVEAVITRYVPGPYDGPVTIFGTPDDLARAGDAQLGWGELMHGEVDLHILPGTHISILRPPHVDEFSARYVPLLRGWQAAVRPS